MRSVRFLLLLAATSALPALATAAPAAAPAFKFQNPVRAGDYPDPSVIRIGEDYWATATSSEWAPHFPILHSRDLVNWEVRGYVFAEAPAWAKSSFWAPEISTYQGRTFVYYTARRHDNRLAVAVASAAHPAGPYTDHGELVSQDAGSIDPVPFTDAKGVRWLIWKEDGNSRKQPTPLWIQRLREDGLALVGERREILRNDAPWEGAVVEGPFVVRRGEYYYLFYAGNACCGRGCNYAVGVARAKEMTGPWEKCPQNPIMAGNDTWRCPGHGSVVADPDGRYWFLYHAYAQKGFVATGREMLLDEVVFGADGWPSVNSGKGPSTAAAGPATAHRQDGVARFRDDFNASGELSPGWQWLVGRRPDAKMANGVLTVTVADEASSTVQSITTPSFVAETGVQVGGLSEGTFAGLVVYGDRANLLSLVTNGQSVQVWNQRRGQKTMVAETKASPGATLRLRVACVDGNKFRFAVQRDGGEWKELAGETDGSFLPPWDRGVRIGVTVAGAKGAAASFDYFTAQPDDATLFNP